MIANFKAEVELYEKIEEMAKYECELVDAVEDALVRSDKTVALNEQTCLVNEILQRIKLDNVSSSD